MQKSKIRSEAIGAMLGLALAAGTVYPGAGDLGHKLDKGYDDMKHALGWDTAGLKVVDRDKAGYPLLERASNASNDIERRTSFHDNGNKKHQAVTVVSKQGGKLLTEQRVYWSEDGKLESFYSQDNAFNKKGEQTKGVITEREYHGEKLVLERGRSYFEEGRAWKPVYREEISYFSDGDMRERTVEKPLQRFKERETWAESKGALGLSRQRSVQKWDRTKGGWE